MSRLRLPWARSSTHPALGVQPQRAQKSQLIVDKDEPLECTRIYTKLDRLLVYRQAAANALMSILLNFGYHFLVLTQTLPHSISAAHPQLTTRAFCNKLEVGDPYSVSKQVLESLTDVMGNQVTLNRFA